MPLPTVIAYLKQIADALQQEALNAFDEALHLEPSNASAWNGKGVVLNSVNRCEDALEAFTMALRFDPHLAEARRRYRTNWAATLRHWRLRKELSKFAPTIPVTGIVRRMH